MQLLTRFILALLLAIQPGWFFLGTDCAAAQSRINHSCRCGDACPALESDSVSIGGTCDCCSEEPAQPAPPTKTANDGRPDFGMANQFPIAVVARHKILPIFRPQLTRAYPNNCSINAFLCVWLT